MAENKRVRIFISSPSDVEFERQRAARVVDEVSAKLDGRLVLEAIRWEDAYYTARSTFQDQIIAPSQSDIVVVILWKRLGSMLPPEFNRADGSPRTGTEYEFEEALEAALRGEVPDILVYRKTEAITFKADSVDHERADLHALEGFWQKWMRNEKGHFTAAFKAFENTDRFADLLRNDLFQWIKRRDDAVTWPIATRGSPFRGLLAFGEDHADVFFGRRQMVKRALARLITAGQGKTAFMLVVGSSGAGKSSLIQAGLVPALQRDGAVPQVDRWRRCIVRPSALGEALLAGLASALFAEDVLGKELAAGDSPTQTALTSYLCEAPAASARPIIGALNRIGEAARKAEGFERPIVVRLLLVIDQLEEIFALPEDAKAAMITVLTSFANSGGVWVVATMRSDFYPMMQAVPELLALKEAGCVLDVPPPMPSELRNIIEGPCRAAGLILEERDGRFLGGMLEDDAQTTTSLPLLQFVLEELFERRDIATGTLQLADYEALGGLTGAIGRRAEAVYTALPKDVQGAFSTAMRHLVTVRSNGAWSSRAEKLDAFVSGSPARHLIDALIAGHLLVADGDTGGTRVRVAHEALLTHWERAREQIAKDVRDIELRDLLETAAKRWRAADKRDRDSLTLAAGRPLVEAVDFVKVWGQAVSGDIRAYVAASQQFQKRRRRRLVFALLGAMALLPISAGVIWTMLVWRGVRAVEATTEFTPIPKGCFSMGSPLNEPGRFDHETQHQVCVAGLELAKYAVTQQDWRLVMVENPDPSRFKGERNPVEMVSWDDARSFVWRMRFFGSRPYRLPTEAEWEYAARAGTTTTWFWGEQIELGCSFANLRDLTYQSRHFNVGEAIINCHDGFDYTAPVGSFKPNGFGLYDMVGNVSQWTEDCFGKYADAPIDGSAVEAKNCEARVVRGGSWNDKPRFTRSAARDVYAPINRNDQVGVRLAW